MTGKAPNCGVFSTGKSKFAENPDPFPARFSGRAQGPWQLSTFYTEFSTFNFSFPQRL